MTTTLTISSPSTAIVAASSPRCTLLFFATSSFFLYLLIRFILLAVIKQIQIVVFSSILSQLFFPRILSLLMLTVKLNSARWCWLHCIRSLHCCVVYYTVFVPCHIIYVFILLIKYFPIISFSVFHSLLLHTIFHFSLYFSVLMAKLLASEKL